MRIQKSSREKFTWDIKSLKDYLSDIERYMREAGPYSHNLVSITLRQIAREYGDEMAYQVIKDFHLDKKFGIIGQ